MDQAKDIPSAGAPAEAAAADAAKPIEAPASTPPAPSISAIETPAIELKPVSDKPSLKAEEATNLKAEGIGAEMFGSVHRFMKPPRIGRFAQLAAAMMLASGLGAFAGAIGATAYFQAAPAPAVKAVATPADTKEVVARLSAELATVRAGIENTARNANAQFAKLGDKFDRAEKAQAEPAAKLSRIGETLERLERRPPAPVPAVPIAVPETTGSIAEKQPAKPPVVEGWVLRDIYDGVALVQSRRGMIEVGPGQNIPGVGRVETIKKQDGRWIVVTPKGIIVSAR